MKQNGKISFIHKLILLFAAVFSFFIANPNTVIKDGIFIFGFLIYLPVLFLVHFSTIKEAWIWGGLYGLFSYGLYAFWLKNFHPLTLYIVCILYFIILAFVFLCLKYIEKIFQKYCWFVQFVFLCAYEYLKTTGFCGFSYGVTAYTQWKNIYLIQICQLVGVFGLNLLVIFPSALLFGFFTNLKKRKSIIFEEKENGKTHIQNFVKSENSYKDLSFKPFFYSASVWIFLMVFSYVFGICCVKSEKKYKDYVTVAAIQNNENPWKNGINEYTKNIKSLINLSQETLEFYDKIDFIVWPETAVVPSIMYHYNNEKDERRNKIIKYLLDFIEENDCVFVIGNAHEVKNQMEGNVERYNSVFVFESKNNVIPPEPGIYSKIHLVPFTEYFPYKHKFPKFYKMLLNGDVNMWEKGDEYTVFTYKNLFFSTPVCFEDTFGDDCRKFVKNGARCFMNLSNDAWSKSEICQKQHEAMAVFRCVENKIPAVRSTSSGQTCIINENGKIIAEAPSFCESYVIGKIPVFKDNFKVSIYTKYGDYAGKIEVLFCMILLIIQTIHVIIMKTRKG